MLTAEEKEKLSQGFNAAGERMNSIENNIKEIEACYKTLTEQFKRYGKALISGTLDGKDHQGFWPNDGMAKEFGMHVLKIIGANVKTMSGAGEGSNLVPIELSNWIIQKLGTYGKFRKYAAKVQMGSSAQLIPKVTADLTIFCPGEKNVIQASDVNVGAVVMVVKKLACLTALSRELDEDTAIGIGEIVGVSMARSIAKKEDLIGFMGDGTEAYFGMTGIVGKLRAIAEDIATIPGLVVGTGNAYSELTLTDFRKVIGILSDDADDNARWYMNKKFYYGVVYPLAETAGVANIFEILSNVKGRFLLGYPVEFISAMPSTEADSQICAILGDLELGAILAERRQLEIARSEDVFFMNDLVALRGTERIDISAHGVGDKNEPEAIVGLITAAG